jgi:hypothetical protein
MRQPSGCPDEQRKGYYDEKPKMPCSTHVVLLLFPGDQGPLQESTYYTSPLAKGGEGRRRAAKGGEGRRRAAKGGEGRPYSIDWSVLLDHINRSRLQG